VKRVKMVKRYIRMVSLVIVNAANLTRPSLLRIQVLKHTVTKITDQLQRFLYKDGGESNPENYNIKLRHGELSTLKLCF
jgi:hypothetical protein